MPRIDGVTLRAWRRSRGWDVPEMARQLRRVAREQGQTVAAQDGLTRMVYAWERDDHALTERYVLLFAKVFDVHPDDLAGGPAVMSLPDQEGDDPVRRREFGMAAMAMGAMSMLDVMRGHSAELPERVAYGARVDGDVAAGLANVVLGTGRSTSRPGPLRCLTRYAERSTSLPNWPPAPGSTATRSFR